MVIVVMDIPTIATGMPTRTIIARNMETIMRILERQVRSNDRCLC